MTNKINKKFSELVCEINLHYHNNREEQPLYHQHLITNHQGEEYLISLEVKPLRQKLKVPEMIKSYLNKNNMSITDLSNVISIGRSALSNFINGKSALSFQLAEKLSVELDIIPETLLKIDIESRYNFYKNNILFQKIIDQSKQSGE